MLNAVMAERNANEDSKLVSLDSSSDQLLTIRQFCFAFPWPSESAMRSYIYRAQELGIEEAFVRVRRRVLVNPSMFFLLIKKLENRSYQGDEYASREVSKRCSY